MEFKYQLKGHGWAEGLVELDSTRLEFVVSDLTNALKDMLDSIILLIPELVPIYQHANCTSFIWEEEPSSTEWVLQTLSKDTLKVTIIFYENSQERNSYNVLIDTTCSFKRFIILIVEEIDNLLKTHGLIGYKETWSTHEFPISSYLKLKYFLLREPNTYSIGGEKRSGIYKSNLNEELYLLKLTEYK